MLGAIRPPLLLKIKNCQFYYLLDILLATCAMLGSFSVLTFFYDEKTIPENNVIGKKRYAKEKSTVYVCSGFVCSAPIVNMKDMRGWFNKNK